MSGTMCWTILMFTFFFMMTKAVADIFFSLKCNLIFSTTITRTKFLDAIKKSFLQFQTFLGLHDSFDHTFRHGFLAG